MKTSTGNVCMVQDKLNACLIYYDYKYIRQKAGQRKNGLGRDAFSAWRRMLSQHLTSNKHTMS